MICERCQGKGYFEYYYPCSVCNGSGIEHCCDGLQEQPESVFGKTIVTPLRTGDSVTVTKVDGSVMEGHLVVVYGKTEEELLVGLNDKCQ